MTDGPYKLPKGWRWVRLGEVAKVCYGRAKPKQTGTVPVVGSGGIYDYVDKPLITFPTIIVGRKGSAGEPVLMKEPCWPSDTTFYLEWLTDIEPEFVFAWLKLHKPSPEGTTATLPSLRREDLESHLIPLPPLSEQRRIVARVEELMARVREARRLRREALEDAERLWQSVLAETFPRPGQELPKGWRWVRLGEVAKAVSGFGFPKRYQGRSSGPIAFLKVSDLNNPDNEPEVRCAANYVDEATLQMLRACAYPPGTIVFPKIGGAIATNKKRKLAVHAAFDNNIMGLIPNHDTISSDYLLLWMYTVDLVTLAKTGPVPSIRKSVVEDQQIPLPPLEEQRRIVAHLEAVQERVRTLKEAQAKTEEELKRLEQAILDKAFRGEL